MSTLKCKFSFQVIKNDFLFFRADAVSWRLCYMHWLQPILQRFLLPFDKELQPNYDSDHRQNQGLRSSGIPATNQWIPLWPQFWRTTGVSDRETVLSGSVQKHWQWVFAFSHLAGSIDCLFFQLSVDRLGSFIVSFHGYGVMLQRYGDFILSLFPSIWFWKCGRFKSGNDDLSTLYVQIKGVLDLICGCRKESIPTVTSHAFYDHLVGIIAHLF